MKLLNGVQFAAEMGVSPLFVTAMKASGYQFQYGTQTTLLHALQWREKNPHFRVTDYVEQHRTEAGRTRRERLLLRKRPRCRALCR